jgi:hypothetical protein
MKDEAMKYVLTVFFIGCLVAINVNKANAQTGSPFCGHLEPGPSCLGNSAQTFPNGVPEQESCVESSRCDPTTHVCSARPGHTMQEVVYGAGWGTNGTTTYPSFHGDPPGTPGRTPYTFVDLHCVVVRACADACIQKFNSGVPYWVCVPTGNPTKIVTVSQWTAVTMCADQPPEE